MPWREIPARWWAVLVGVAFGSLALVAMDGPRKGYGKATIAAILTAPLLSVIAGSLLRDDTTLEMAAAIGGVVAVGGMAVILAVARFAPALVVAGLTGMANTFLHISASGPNEKPTTLRLRQDGTPEDSNPELEELARKLDDDQLD